MAVPRPRSRVTPCWHGKRSRQDSSELTELVESRARTTGLRRSFTSVCLLLEGRHEVPQIDDFDSILDEVRVLCDRREPFAVEILEARSYS